MKKWIALLCCFMLLPWAVYAYDGEVKTYFNGTASAVVDQSVDTVHPAYFEILSDGTFRLNAVDRNTVSKLKQKGVRIEPYLSNHWNRDAGIKALENGAEISSQIAEAVYEYGFDGVNVDIENLSHEQKDLHTEFVRLLKQKMPDKTVAVAIAANPNQWATGWHGSYDLKAMGEICDYLMLMGYDESYSGGPEGPVASGPWVERSIKAVLKDVPASKLVLGIPYFGRGWSADGALKGFSISQKDVERLKQGYSYKQGYDVAAQSAWLELTVPEGGPLPSVLGYKELPPGKYTLWYDDVRAGRYKLKLAKKYGLKGIDTWAYGQEIPRYWEIFSESFRYFQDTAGHWAESGIDKAYEYNTMQGKEDQIFQPEEKVTRAEAAVVMVRMGGHEKEKGYHQFSDTSGHWADPYLAVAYEKGLISGVGNNEFRPDEALTRQDFCVMLSKLLQLPNQGNAVVYPDVDKTSYAYPYIRNLASNGLIQGYEDGTFGPADRLSRAEMAALTVRATEF